MRGPRTFEEALASYDKKNREKEALESKVSDKTLEAKKAWETTVGFLFALACQALQRDESPLPWHIYEWKEYTGLSADCKISTTSGVVLEHLYPFLKERGPVVMLIEGGPSEVQFVAQETEGHIRVHARFKGCSLTTVLKFLTKLNVRKLSASNAPQSTLDKLEELLFLVRPSRGDYHGGDL